jgi:hypothetical protein
MENWKSRLRLWRKLLLMLSVSALIYAWLLLYAPWVVGRHWQRFEDASSLNVQAMELAAISCTLFLGVMMIINNSYVIKIIDTQLGKLLRLRSEEKRSRTWRRGAVKSLWLKKRL